MSFLGLEAEPKCGFELISNLIFADLVILWSLVANLD
jgi:hypothetical protein